jgi:hypothetical protein
MMAVSDGVVIGIVLGLVFAAVSYYLHTRMTQLEKKVGYMEGILLDLKVTTEQAILSANEPVEHEGMVSHNEHTEKVAEFESTIDQTSRVRPPTPTPTPTHTPTLTPVAEEESQRRASSSSASVTPNYESMTYKELQQVARQRNISGIRNLSKAQVIDIIRAHDNGTAPPVSVPTPLTAWKGEETGHEMTLDAITAGNTGNDSTGPVSIDATLSSEPEMSLVGSE